MAWKSIDAARRATWSRATRSAPTSPATSAGQQQRRRDRVGDEQHDRRHGVRRPATSSSATTAAANCGVSVVQSLATTTWSRATCSALPPTARTPGANIRACYINWLGNTIGGTTAAARNVISGNVNGIEMDGGSANSDPGQLHRHRHNRHVWRSATLTAVRLELTAPPAAPSAVPRRSRQRPLRQPGRGLHPEYPGSDQATWSKAT